MNHSDPPSKTALSPSAGLPEPAVAAQAVAQVLQPLARLMIGYGLQLAPIVELLKKALVEEAQTAYGLADKASSDTRVALLTGVHRKDVKRLREVPDNAVEASSMVPVASAVVARWISEPRYLNLNQTARILARTPTRGMSGEPDFTTLVAEVSRDVGARAVLDELVRLGVVVVREDGYVELSSDAFVPKDGLSESFHFLAANVSDHLSVAVHNLASDRQAPKMLEQSAFSENLSPQQAEELQQRARQLWATALQQFLQSATIAEQRSQGDAGPRHRVRLGVYFYDALQAKDAESAVITKTVRKAAGKKAKP